MVIFPNCKINLGLSIVAKRSDGYHDLETIFYPVPIFDALEIIEQPSGNKDSFSISGREIPGDQKTNLCLRAMTRLREDFSSIPPVSMYLHKAIPTGAGLGGGSADAAFTLRLLNNKFNLGIAEDKLTFYASLLGSDCPFFILNTPCVGTGRGDLLQKIGLSLKGIYMMLVNPGIHVSTADAFRMIQPGRNSNEISKIVSLPISEWRDALVNDFELPVFEKHPEIRLIKDRMYEHGAIYASMSGSGSSVFGLFGEKVSIDFGMSETWSIQL